MALFNNAPTYTRGQLLSITYLAESGLRVRIGSYTDFVTVSPIGRLHLKLAVTQNDLQALFSSQVSDQVETISINILSREL
jgi:hypothetical protein